MKSTKAKVKTKAQSNVVLKQKPKAKLPKLTAKAAKKKHEPRVVAKPMVAPPVPVVALKKKRRARVKVEATTAAVDPVVPIIVEVVAIASVVEVQTIDPALALTQTIEPVAEPVPELTPEQIAKEEKKKAAKSARMYFNANTQAAIVAFQTTTERKDRDRLYVKEIMPAFEKLVENLINIHKFTSLHDTYDDLKNDCVNFLFETIGKFDGNRGTNAFSYFNVVAKNWLIIRTKQKAQRMKRSVSLDDPDSLSANESRIIEDHCIVPSQDIVLENESTAKNIVRLLFEIRNKAKSENELICINSIITIFENINDVDMLNKSAVLVYMRELSGLTPKQLTTTLQNIKKQYRRLKIDPKFKIF